MLLITHASHLSALNGQSESPYEQIGIDSYGASITTMDEIFLKVTHQDEIEQESEKSLRIGLPNL